MTMIEEASYTESGGIRAVIDGAVVFIPDDPSNRERRQVSAWEADGNTITPFAVPLAETVAAARAEVLAHADALCDAFIADYPEGERQSWPQKQVEARAILDGETDPDAFPVIAAEADVTGAVPADIASWILARAAVFEKAAGIISGFRQVAFAGIEAAEDADEVAAALEAAKALASQKLAALE